MRLQVKAHGKYSKKFVELRTDYFYNVFSDYLTILDTVFRYGPILSAPTGFFSPRPIQESKIILF